MEHFMMNGRWKKTPLLILGAATAGLLALSGCGQGEDSGAQASSTAEPSSSASAGAQTSDPGASPSDATPSTSSAASDSATGDPVFTALDAVMAEHSGATVIAVSQEESGGVYEFDLVEGETVLELESSAGGDVRETGSDQDAEDVAAAQEAQVTVEDAITTALDGRSDRMVDEAELDHHGGQLVWEIDLDDAQGSSAEQVNVDAVSGDVVNG